MLQRGQSLNFNCVVLDVDCSKMLPTIFIISQILLVASALQAHLLQRPKVSVILGVMSQCPDAIYCESVFDKVIQEVSDIVNFKLTFIGKFVPLD